MIRVWCNHQRSLVALVFVSLMLIPSLVHAQGQGGLVVATGQHYSGDISTVSEPVLVEGDVAGDVTTWSGDIIVNGHVSGDVVSYTGHISVGPNGQVEGSVMSVGGGVERHTQALVARVAIGGPAENAALSSAMGIVMPQTVTSLNPDYGAMRVIMGVLAGVFVLACSLLWGAFWPNRTRAASLALRNHPLRSLVVGSLAALAVVIAAPLLIGLLAASLIGLPILVALFLVVHAPFVYGLAAGARAFDSSETVPPTAMPPRVTWVALLVAAVGIAVVCAFMPVVGLLLFYALSAPGLGAVLLSRGGLIVPLRATQA